MPAILLLQSAIDAGLAPGDYHDRELRNFGIRVGARRAVYYVRVREGGVRVRVELAEATGRLAIKLKAARSAAAEKLRQHAEGKALRPPVVPAGAIAAGAALDAETLTVAQLVEAFLEEHLPTWGAAHAGHQQLFGRRIVIPAFGNQRARAVTRLQIKGLTRTHAKQAPINANRLHAFLSKMFRWAMSEDSGGGEPLLDKNPMDQMRKPTIEIPRERELTPAEIVHFWTALDAIDADASATPRDRALAAYWRLRLLTGQREQSLRRLEWNHVNLTDNILEIPAALMKGRKGQQRPHVVPLGPRAGAILAQRLAVASPLDRFVFGTRPGTSRAPGKPRGVPQGIALEDFQGHDLRRTAYTLMTSHGVTGYHADRVMGHKHTTVGGRVYNRYEYLAEKRVALELLDRLVTTILSTAPAQQARVVAFVRP